MRLEHLRTGTIAYDFRIGKKRGEELHSKSSSEEEEDSNPFDGAKPTDQLDSDEGENDEEVEDSFIEHDDNSARPDLPAQFNLNTFQDLDVQFKVIFQLFVHLGVKPANVRQEVMSAFMEGQSLSYLRPFRVSSLIPRYA